MGDHGVILFGFNHRAAGGHRGKSGVIARTLSYANGVIEGDVAIFPEGSQHHAYYREFVKEKRDLR